jgi:hypothetical protein
MAFSDDMAIHLWMFDREWMFRNAPEQGRHSWSWFHARKELQHPLTPSEKAAKAAEKRAYTAQAVREHRARVRAEADPVKHAAGLVRRYLREKKPGAALRVHTNAVATVAGYQQIPGFKRLDATVRGDTEALARLDKELDEMWAGLRSRREHK